MAGHEVVAHGHGQREVEEEDGGRPGQRLGLDDLEIVGCQLHRHAAAGPAHGVVHRAGQVEVERVAELVGLGRLLAVVPGPRPRGPVRSHPVLGQLREEVREGLLADAADALRRELEPALALVDEPGVGQLLGQIGQPVEGAGGVLTQVARHLVQVDLGERGRRLGRAEEVLELVEVAQRGRRIGGISHAHRLVAPEREALIPAGPREGPLEVAGQPVHLPTQVHVLEQALGQSLQLRPLLGRHRVPHGLGGGHPGGQLLEQFVEVGGVAGEQVAVLLHERLETRVDGFAGLALFDHPVEGVEGVAHVLELGRVGVGQRLRHLLEVGTGHLLTETLHQVLEVLARLR